MKQTDNFWYSTLFLLLGALLTQSCLGSVRPANSAPVSANWTTGQWTGDDSPYLIARTRITHEIEASKDPLGAINSYKVQAILRPWSHLAVFCWAVAALEASNYARSDDEYERCINDVKTALAIPGLPYVREYARIRYLFEIDGNWQDPDLKALGDRLLSTNRKDPYVLEEAACSHEDDVPRAVSMLDESIKIEPGHPAPWCILAYIYMDAFEYDNGPVAYGHMAVQDFRKYLSMSPRNKDSIKWALHYMEEVSSMLASGKRAYG